VTPAAKRGPKRLQHDVEGNDQMWRDKRSRSLLRKVKEEPKEGEELRGSVAAAVTPKGSVAAVVSVPAERTSPRVATPKSSSQSHEESPTSVVEAEEDLPKEGPSAATEPVEGEQEGPAEDRVESESSSETEWSAPGNGPESEDLEDLKTRLRDEKDRLEELDMRMRTAEKKRDVKLKELVKPSSSIEGRDVREGRQGRAQRSVGHLQCSARGVQDGRRQSGGSTQGAWRREGAVARGSAIDAV